MIRISSLKLAEAYSASESFFGNSLKLSKHWLFINKFLEFLRHYSNTFQLQEFLL